MYSGPKADAIAQLVQLCNDINGLGKSYPYSSQHTRWIANVLRLLESIFGHNSRYYLTFSRFTWRFRGTTMVMTYELLGRHPDELMRDRNQIAFLDQLESAHGLLAAAVDELEDAPDLAEVYDGKNTGPEVSSIVKLINVVERKFRKVVHNRPKVETEVQNCFEALLIGADIPYSREKVSFEYSSRSYRPDFTSEQLDLAIEIKLCTTQSREKEIVCEVNDDILAYKTRFGNVLFVIYDLGAIRDIERFAKQFESHESVIVRVIKH